MTKEKLLESLKAEAVFFDENALRERLNDVNREMLKNKTALPSQKLSKYNIETMLELKIKTLPAHENDFIDDASVQTLKSAIDDYMEKYAEGQEELKTYIRIITVYLTFVVEKPLHPAGMFDTEGKVLYRNDKVVCPLRTHEINKPGSLCRFCASIA
ncbi:MAG: DUF2115 domain-containing protein [Spirochaetaceae bacterium]|jgi:uncharacterized protein (UPF0305 family)|nr:DUF2115 domain-containing protein [Spirochaetaceae bacterium]